MILQIIKLLSLLLQGYQSYQAAAKAKAIHVTKASIKKMSDAKVTKSLKSLMKKKKK